MGYLTATEASSRLLSRFEIVANVLPVHAEMAHDSLKRARPFIGGLYDYNQQDDFPRSITLDGDTENVVPDAVLDYIALRAASLALSDTMELVAGESKGVDTLRTSTNYARPKMSKLEVYLKNVSSQLGRYQRQTGELV